MLGDFNSARYTYEKVGGNQLSFTHLALFHNYIDHCSLSDIRSIGNKWSWHNNSIGINRILGRLDRVLCNQSWIALLSYSFNKYHSLASSDHAPITLHLLTVQDAGPKPSRFCHAPLPKICENGVATRVGDVYTREEYLTYTHLA